MEETSSVAARSYQMIRSEERDKGVVVEGQSILTRRRGIGRSTIRFRGRRCGDGSVRRLFRHHVGEGDRMPRVKDSKEVVDAVLQVRC